MAEKTLYNYRVEPQDVDFTRRATLAALSSVILNTAGNDAFGKGFGVNVLNEENHSWVLARMAFEFDRLPIQYTDYTVATWVSDYGRLLTTRNFTFCDANGVEFGRSATQWVVIDLKSRTAVNLQAMDESYAHAVVNIPPPIELPRKIRQVNPTQTVEHRVVYSDIDFNSHVNTMRYLDMMLDMLPIEQLAHEGFVRLDVHFLHECCYGQTLTVGYEQRDNVAFFEISNEEKVVAVKASIEWK